MSMVCVVDERERLYNESIGAFHMQYYIKRLVTAKKKKKKKGRAANNNKSHIKKF